MSLPDDPTLARLATEAGLCITQCWDISLALDPASRQEDAAWVAAAKTPTEHAERQRVADHAAARAADALSKLRCFAELLAAHQTTTK